MTINEIFDEIEMYEGKPINEIIEPESQKYLGERHDNFYNKFYNMYDSPIKAEIIADSIMKGEIQNMYLVKFKPKYDK